MIKSIIFAVMTALDVVMIFAHLFMFCLAILTFAVSRNEVSESFHIGLCEVCVSM